MLFFLDKTFTTFQRLRRVYDNNPKNTIFLNDIEKLNYESHLSNASARKLQEKTKDLWHPFENLQKTYTKKELQVKFFFYYF